MKIYIDFDDCLCETARSFCEIGKRLYGKDVPYERIRSFNLQESFDLTDEQYEEFMHEGHKPEVILGYEETPGASRVINEWIDQGKEVFIITGRPYSTYETSRKWLDDHDLSRVQLFFLNKYGRDFFYKDSTYNLELEDYYKMKFDVAIEDSPMAFKFFDHLPDLKVMLFNRPWNEDCKLPGDNYHRSPDWDWIREQVG